MADNLRYALKNGRHTLNCMKRLRKKLELTALYYGLDNTWYHSLILSRGVVTWPEFKEELCDRFCLEYFDDIVYEFNSI